MTEASREHLGWVLQESGRICTSPYLDRHGSLARPLCESGVRAWVVYGEHDDIGITADERALLDATPRVNLVEVAGAGHRAAPAGLLGARYDGDGSSTRLRAAYARITG